MTRAEFLTIVTEPETAYAARAERLARLAEDAYGRYHGVAHVFPVRPGTPRAAGHGTSIGGFVGQAEWLAATGLRNLTARIRRGTDNAWYPPTVADGVASYRFRFSSDIGNGTTTEVVEIVTHGVDVSACRTPTAAILKVQREATPVHG